MVTPATYTAPSIKHPRIHDVRTKALRLIADERGYLMEMLRADDELFSKFGQAYVSATYPGAVKAWHYHKVQVDHFVCVAGMIRRMRMLRCCASTFFSSVANASARSLSCSLVARTCSFIMRR